jgi:hypothetical protein
VTAPSPVAVVAHWANPRIYSGACPAVIRFHGRLLGDWGAAAYQWLRSDGVRMPVEQMSFNAPQGQSQERIATYAWEVAESSEIWAVIDAPEGDRPGRLEQRAGKPVTKVVCAPDGASAQVESPLREDLYVLGRGAEGYELRYARTSQQYLSIPAEWLIPEEEEPDVVSSFAYDEHVTAFEMGRDLTGIHISSYDIQEEGSLQAAEGRDVFLVIDRRANRLEPGLVDLGVTKWRARYMGCFEAGATAFLLADIDQDGVLDIGAEREEIECREVTRVDDDGSEIDGVDGPHYVRHPLRWHTFRDGRWRHDAKLDGRSPGPELPHWELPLIGIAKTPVDFVRELDQGERP